MKCNKCIGMCEKYKITRTTQSTNYRLRFFKVLADLAIIGAINTAAEIK